MRGPGQARLVAGAALAAALGGCASIGDGACDDGCAEVDGGVVPAPTGGDGGVDAAPPLGPFGAPVPIAELNESLYAEENPSATGDLLELYFDSNRPGGQGGRDIWVSRRRSVDDPWGPAAVVVELSSTALDGDPEISADGLTIHLSSDRAGTSGGLDIWVATRKSRTAVWSTPVLVPELSSPARDVAAAMTPDQLTVVLHSARAGTNDLYLATRRSTAEPWSTPVPIDELNGPASESNGSLTSDGLTLFYASDEPGGLGGDDIYVASRPGLGEPFGAPAAVDGMATDGRDGDPFISFDGRTLLFTSNRAGTNDLYMATR
jgi:Tol biopolymer transport system component